MKKVQLNQEEKNILEAFETGKSKSVNNPQKEKEKYKEFAKHTLTKSMTINIRIAEKDLRKIKVMAAEKGLPYQTFITSILHQQSRKRGTNS